MKTFTKMSTLVDDVAGAHIGYVEKYLREKPTRDETNMLADDSELLYLAIGPNDSVVRVQLLIDHWHQYHEDNTIKTAADCEEAIDAIETAIFNNNIKEQSAVGKLLSEVIELIEVEDLMADRDGGSNTDGGVDVERPVLAPQKRESSCDS